MPPITSTQAAAAPGGTPGPDAARHRKLVDAAQQFEAMFLQEMLKPMSSMGKGDDASTEDDGGNQGTYQSFGTEAVAKAVAKAGGLGIARHVVESVELSSQQGKSASAAGTVATTRPLRIR